MLVLQSELKLNPSSIFLEVFGTPLCNFDNGIFIFYRLMTIFGLVAMSLEIVVKIFLKFSSKFSTSRKTLFGAKYFRYFCPSILCYIITTIPMIQMLMVHQYYGNSVQLNCTSNQTGSVIVKKKFYVVLFLKHLKAFVEPLMLSEKTRENIRFRESDQIWVLAYHQLFLFILVAGRAVMPRNGSNRIIPYKNLWETIWTIWHGWYTGYD